VSAPIKDREHHFQQQANFMDLCKMPRSNLRQLIIENGLTHPRFLLEVALWSRLINEEVNTELRSHLNDLLSMPIGYLIQSEEQRLNFVTKLADDIIDAIYVIDGLSNLFGLPRDVLFQEVHKTNMAKAQKDGEGNLIVMRRADGKILKPEGWQPPNLRSIIEAWSKI